MSQLTDEELELLERQFENPTKGIDHKKIFYSFHFKDRWYQRMGRPLTRQDIDKINAEIVEYTKLNDIANKEHITIKSIQGQPIICLGHNDYKKDSFTYIIKTVKRNLPEEHHKKNQKKDYKW